MSSEYPTSEAARQAPKAVPSGRPTSNAMTTPPTQPTTSTESRHISGALRAQPSGQAGTQGRARVDQGQGGLSWPAAGIADWLGLVAALAIAVLMLGRDHAEVRLFVAVLAVNGIILHLVFQQARSLGRILRRRQTAHYALPSLAAGAAWIELTVGGIPLPPASVLPFVVFWTAALAIGRGVFAQRRPPLRVLLIGSPRFRAELDALPNVDVVCLDEPPEHFGSWDVVVTDPLQRYDSDWLEWISHADMFDLKVLSAPLLLETLTDRVPTEMLHGRWALEVIASRSQYLRLKHVLDIVAVVLSAPLLLPICAVVALVVRLDVGSPILFVQERVGLSGRPFRMLKFRTMVVDAEEQDPAFTSIEDPRVTRIGRFLRRHRLDELPQLWNTLKGEMSLIGPRPEQASFVREFQRSLPLYDLRHNVRPGISGWAQVRQGYAAGTDETEMKLRYDFYYVKRCSLGLDAAIVWRTVLTILSGAGAR